MIHGLAVGDRVARPMAKEELFRNPILVRSCAHSTASQFVRMVAIEMPFELRWTNSPRVVQS